MRIIIDRGEKSQNSKEKTKKTRVEMHKNSQQNSLPVDLGKIKFTQQVSESQEGNLNPERVENGQGKMPKVSLKTEAEEQRELCGVGIWEKSGTSS